MRGFFSNKVTQTTSHIIGKADKKKLSAGSGVCLDAKKEYRIYMLSNKAKLIKAEGKALYFVFRDKTLPTIQNFDRAVHKTVQVDDGALGPLMRGADVMASGILKFEASCSEFAAEEVLGVEVVGVGIVAVGLSMVSSAEMKRVREGPAVDILHLKDDALDRGAL